MKLGFRICEPALAALLLSPATIATAPAAAQQASSSSIPTQDNSTSPLSPGTTICVALGKTIDARNAKPGDAIYARVTLPVLAKGKVYLANDAKIAGHVVSVRPRAENEGSKLAIIFDHVTLKDGRLVAIPLTVQAIGKSEFTAEDLSDPGTPGPPGSAPRATQPSPGRGPGMLPPPMGHDASPPTPSNPNSDSPQAEHPALDTGSHGAVGLPNLTLTEAPDATSGSVIRAAKKNVKLESGMEMILRVVEPTKTDKPAGQN